MTFKVVEHASRNIVELTLSGKLTAEAYEMFVPELDNRIETHGKVRMLIELHDFHGWDCGALWADTRFAARHFKDIERIAIVGETAWEHGMAVFCKPFTLAKVRYFDRSKIDEAHNWIEENTAG